MKNPTLKKLGLRQPRTIAELRNHPLTAELHPLPRGVLRNWKSGKVWCLVVVKGFYLGNQLRTSYSDARGVLDAFAGIRECSSGKVHGKNTNNL